MRRSICLSLSLIALLLASSPARAEVFVLKSGGRIEAEHLNPNRERGQPYRIRTDAGVQLLLAENAVHRVIVKSDLDRQYDAQLPALKNTVEDHWSLAEWCKEAGLLEKRRVHLQAVIALEPDHAEARKALGYQRYGSRWLTQDEFMTSQGYQRYKGSWRLPQEIAIETRETEHELAVKSLRRDVFRWFDQVARGGRYVDMAERELAGLNDPAAAPALAEILGDTQRPRSVRKRALEILARLPPGLAKATHIRVALNDSDAGLQDGCLDELIRQGTHSVLSVFLDELKNKDNARVNRAADCLGRLGDPNATLPLINALVTEHAFKVQPGPPPGSMSATFSPSAAPGAGGLSMGGRPITVKKKLENASVRNALTLLHPGVNHQYDVEEWRSWYVQSQTTTQVDLRRDD